MTQVTLSQLQDLCQQQLPKVCVVFGGEPLQTRRAVDIVRAAARNQSYTEIKSYEVAKQFDWQAARSEEQNQGLFAQHQLIELHLHDAKMNVKAQKALSAWLNEAHEDVYFLLVAGLSSKLDKATWFKPLFQKSITVAAKPILAHQYLRWVAEQFQAAGLSTAAPAYQTIAHVTQGNLLAVEQLIIKLQLLYPDEKELTFAQVKVCLQQDAEHTVFEWIDALLSGDQKRTFKVLHSLNYKGVEPTLILWAITRELRLLQNIGQDRQNGKEWQAIAAQYQLWQSRMRLIKSYLLKTKSLQFDTLFSLSFLAEQIIKGQEKGDVWQVFGEIAAHMLGFSIDQQEEVPLCKI